MNGPINFWDFEMYYRYLVPVEETYVESNTFSYQPSYRYGFNGMERDDEVKGIGNSYDFGARIYDPRIGRFFSLDPNAENYQSLSDYAFVGNMPIWAVDPDGKDIVIITEYDYQKDQPIAVVTYIPGMSTVGLSPFAQETVAALDEIYNSQSSGAKLDVLVKHTEHTVFIREYHETLASPGIYLDQSSGEYFSKSSSEVKFNEHLGLKEVSTGKVNAPFINLWHELGHVANALASPNDFAARSAEGYKENSPDYKWTDAEEKYNIIENENPLSTEKGSFTRDSHRKNLGKQVTTVRTTASTSDQETP